METNIEEEGVLLVAQVTSEYDEKLTLRKGQLDVLQHIAMTSNDIIASFPTGYGKSLIFHLCGKIRGHISQKIQPITLVIIPLNIIQTDQLISLKKHNIGACSIGTEGTIKYLNHKDEIKIGKKEDVECGKYSVIIAHPEGILSTAMGRELLGNRQFAKNVVAIVVDECHTVNEWGEKFRTDFGQLCVLRTFFDCPLYALSATVPLALFKKLEKALGLQNPTIFKQNPDKPNIFLEIENKEASNLPEPIAETVFKPILDKLKKEGTKYPVTLMYIPLEWAAMAQGYACEVFGRPKLEGSLYGIIFSGQDDDIYEYIVKQLKMEKPTMRLILCSTVVGMGFDSPSITQVIHAKPPRKMIDFVQQIGRAGRANQKSNSIVYYNNNDLSTNTTGMDDVIRRYCRSTTCLRMVMLEYFGFNSKATTDQNYKCCSVCNPPVKKK